MAQPRHKPQTTVIGNIQVKLARSIQVLGRMDVKRCACYLVAILGCTVVFFLLRYSGQPNDPVFQGKPLSTWVRELSLDNSEESRSNAVLAICAIGTSAVPLLVNYLSKADHSPTMRIVSRIWSKMARQPIPEDPIFRRLQAVQGFKVLGPLGQSAIPELKRLMLNRKLAYDAARALGALQDPELLPMFIDYMADSDPKKRAAAVAGCESMGEGAQSAVSKIIHLMNKDQEDWVRASAASALGSIGPADVVISPLIQCLENDRSATVRACAAFALGAFPQNLHDFETELRRASRDQSIQVRSVAGQTIKKLLQASPHRPALDSR